MTDDGLLRSGTCMVQSCLHRWACAEYFVQPGADASSVVGQQGVPNFHRIRQRPFPVCNFVQGLLVGVGILHLLLAVPADGNGAFTFGAS